MLLNMHAGLFNLTKDSMPPTSPIQTSKPLLAIDVVILVVIYLIVIAVIILLNIISETKSINWPCFFFSVRVVLSQDKLSIWTQIRGRIKD